MVELIDKWEVVNKLIRLENNYQFYKKQWDAEVLYRRICELEIGIGKTPGIKWIPVAERLPNENEDVLCSRGNHIGALMDVYTYKGNNKWEDTYGYWNYGDIEGITHWMPLPEPPREDN